MLRTLKLIYMKNYLLPSSMYYKKNSKDSHRLALRDRAKLLAGLHWCDILGQLWESGNMHNEWEFVVM